MRVDRFTFSLAIVLSLAVHLLLLPTSRWVRIGRAAAPATVEKEVAFTLSADTQASARSAADPPDEMGEPTGKGTGAQSAAGDVPLRAREGEQDQAFLSRDPVGHGKVGDPPAFDTGPRGENGHGGQVGAETMTPPVATPTPAAAAPSPPAAPPASPPLVTPTPPTPPVASAEQPPVPTVTPDEKAGLGKDAEVAPPPAPIAKVIDRRPIAMVTPPAPPLAAPAAATPPAPTPKPAPPTPSPRQPIITTGDARAPGVDHPSADPAQESDSESDPFQEHPMSAILRDGKLEVRGGRKVKTTRPNFLPGALGDFLANPNPSVLLKVSILPSGAVKNVDIVRSSGSVQIDTPCRVAVYDWWFEPTHDKRGRPIGDVVLFTIDMR